MKPTTGDFANDTINMVPADQINTTFGFPTYVPAPAAEPSASPAAKPIEDPTEALFGALRTATEMLNLGIQTSNANVRAQYNTFDPYQTTIVAERPAADNRPIFLIAALGVAAYFVFKKGKK